MTNEEAIDRLKRDKCLLDGNDNCRCQWVTEGFGSCDECEFGVAIKALKAQKVGHWIKTPKAVMGEGYMWYCDQCEHQVYQDSSRDYPSENYCPNCGAKMKE